MKIKDIIPLEIDIDVMADNDEWMFAYCGPMKLTDEGVTEFSDVLEYNCEFSKYCDWPILNVLIDTDDQNDRLQYFVQSIAGYCSCEDYDRWFIDGFDD